MTVDSNISDPNGAGNDAGQSQTPPAGGTQDPAAGQQSTPAGRTYTDADMAAARRSFEADAQKTRDRAIAELRAEFEQRYMPKPEQKPTDPWSALDPSVADVLRGIFEHEFGTRLTPLQTQAQDIAFQTEESRVKAQYPDYEKNRTAILEFAVENRIPNLDVAYHAWRSQTQWKDPEAIRKQAIADWQKNKAKQASETPAVEGRGGGAPSSKQALKDRDDMDEAAKEIFRSAEANV